VGGKKKKGEGREEKERDEDHKRGGKIRAMS